LRGQLFDRAKGRIGSQLFAGEAHEAVRFGIAIAMKNLILARNVLLENHVRTPRKFGRPTKGEQFLRTLHDKALLEPLFLTILFLCAPLVWSASSVSLLDKICLRLC